MPTAGRNPSNRLDERLFPTVDVLERPAAGLRGGPERTRTACQPRSRYRTDLRPVANRLVCNPALESQHFGSCRRTIGTSIPVGRDIGNHAFVERDFLDLAWHAPS